MFQGSFIVACRKGSVKGISRKIEGFVKVTFKWVSSVFERSSKDVPG